MGRDIFRYQSFFRRSPSSCCQVCKLVGPIIEIAYGAVAVGPSNRKPPDGLTCTVSVLEKVFRLVYQICSLLPIKTPIDHICRKFSRRKCSCVDDKTFVLLHTGLTIFPVSCPKSVSQRDTAVSSQKRPKSVLDTDDPYHVACLQNVHAVVLRGLNGQWYQKQLTDLIV